MWSLGRVLDTPEVCRVYVGSFHAGEELGDLTRTRCLVSQKFGGTRFHAIDARVSRRRRWVVSFRRSARSTDAVGPTAPEVRRGDGQTYCRICENESATRRVNEFKRARLLKAHCYLLDHLREQMPSGYGFQKEEAKIARE